MIYNLRLLILMNKIFAKTQIKSIFLGASETPQQLGVPTWRLTATVTPASRDQCTSGLHGFQAHMWCTYTYSGKHAFIQNFKVNIFLGQWNGSSGKGTCHQPRGPKFDPWGPHGEKGPLQLSSDLHRWSWSGRDLHSS